MAEAQTVEETKEEVTIDDNHTTREPFAHATKRATVMFVANGNEIFKPIMVYFASFDFLHKVIAHFHSKITEKHRCKIIVTVQLCEDDKAMVGEANVEWEKLASKYHEYAEVAVTFVCADGTSCTRYC